MFDCGGGMSEQSAETLPLVSIVTPVYNADKSGYLEMCIESVLHQGYPNIEHVFADGGSSDGTIEKLRAYSAKFPGRIRFISEPDNGVGSALKKAYALSRGEILGWIDADDFYQPNAVQTIVEYFRNYPRAQFVYGGCKIVDDNSKHIGNFIVSDFDKGVWLNVQHYLIFAAAFFRRDVIESCGFVNDLGNDLYFYLNVAKRHKLYRIPEILSNWRLHSMSISLRRSEREDKIRRQRAREDFFLVVRHGGSVFSPRAMTYLAVLEPLLARKVKWMIPKSVEPAIKRLLYQMRFSIARAETSNSGGFALPLMKKILNSLVPSRKV
jgi:glycosyltransferase involved in cell wall biosynthesis